MSPELPFHMLLKNTTFRHLREIGKTRLEPTIMHLALIAQRNVSPLAVLNQFKIFELVIIRAKEYKPYSESQYLAQKWRYGDPKLKNPCPDLRNVYHGS